MDSSKSAAAFLLESHQRIGQVWASESIVIGHEPYLIILSDCMACV
jgi:hypothetical protein